MSLLYSLAQPKHVIQTNISYICAVTIVFIYKNYLTRLNEVRAWPLHSEFKASVDYIERHCPLGGEKVLYKYKTRGFMSFKEK